MAASDNSALAKDCRRDIKAANAALLKLSRKVPALPSSHPSYEVMQTEEMSIISCSAGMSCHAVDPFSGVVQ